MMDRHAMLEQERQRNLERSGLKVGDEVYLGDGRRWWVHQFISPHTHQPQAHLVAVLGNEPLADSFNYATTRDLKKTVDV